MFIEQVKFMDELAKTLRPTRGGLGTCTAKQFMEVTEREFALRKWNFTAYVGWANENHNARISKERRDKGLDSKEESSDVGSHIRPIPLVKHSVTKDTTISAPASIPNAPVENTKV